MNNGERSLGNNAEQCLEPPHDYEAYQALQFLKKYAAMEYAEKSGAVLSSAAALFVSAYSIPHQSPKFSRLDVLVGKLLKDFKYGSPSINIYPCLKIDKYEPLDVYIRIHKRTNILISVRSKSKSKIIYDIAKKWIYSRRRYRGRSRWRNCPIEELNYYAKWLSKNRKLFGLSSRQTHLPLIKIVAICSPTEIAEHGSKNYCYLEGEKILILKKRGKVYFMSEDRVIDFIKAYLADEIKYQIG